MTTLTPHMSTVVRVAYLPANESFLDFKADLIELDCRHFVVIGHDCDNRSLVGSETECKRIHLGDMA